MNFLVHLFEDKPDEVIKDCGHVFINLLIKGQFQDVVGNTPREV